MTETDDTQKVKLEISRNLNQEQLLEKLAETEEQLKESEIEKNRMAAVWTYVFFVILVA